MTTNLSLAIAYFKGVLVKAQEERPSRQGLVTDPNGEMECEWAAFERRTAHEKINDMRAQNGHDRIPLELVEKVERQAVGHSDYTDKFALYCAELAMDIDRPK